VNEFEWGGDPLREQWVGPLPRAEGVRLNQGSMLQEAHAALP
jgi:hypothetical protein